MSSNAAPPPGGNFADLDGMSLPGGGGAMAPEAELIGGDFGGTYPQLQPDGTEALVPFVGPDGMLNGPQALRPGATGHTYYEGYQFDTLRQMNTEDRTRLQQQLVAVGLAANPMFGEIDDSTVNAMSKLMSMANRSGTSWEATLGRLATNPALQEETQQFEEQPYLAMDTASIAQEVKDTFRKRLGRDPDKYEMAELSAELTGYDRLSYEREQEFRQVAHEQANTPGVQEPGEVQSVDPMARFQQMFDSRYENELDFVEDKEQAQVSRAVVEGGASTLSRMSRGG